MHTPIQRDEEIETRAMAAVEDPMHVWRPRVRGLGGLGAKRESAEMKSRKKEDSHALLYRDTRRTLKWCLELQKRVRQSQAHALRARGARGARR